MKNLQEISNQLEHKVKPVSYRKPEVDSIRQNMKNEKSWDRRGSIGKSQGINSPGHTDENEKKDRN